MGVCLSSLKFRLILTLEKATTYVWAAFVSTKLSVSPDLSTELSIQGVHIRLHILHPFIFVWIHFTVFSSIVSEETKFFDIFRWENYWKVSNFYVLILTIFLKRGGNLFKRVPQSLSIRNARIRNDPLNSSIIRNNDPLNFQT